jgi:hypothetical protein
MKYFLRLITYFFLVLSLTINAKGVSSMDINQPGTAIVDKSIEGQPVAATVLNSGENTSNQREFPDLPVDTALKNLKVFQGQDYFYLANRILTVSGPDKPVIVRKGATLNLVSGQTIVFLPGTKVSSGGYLHATIITDAGERNMASRKMTRPSDLAKMANPDETISISEAQASCSPFARSSKGDFREKGNNDQSINALIPDVSGVVTEHNRKVALAGQSRNQFAPQHLFNFSNKFFLTFSGKPEATRVLRL